VPPEQLPYPAEIGNGAAEPVQPVYSDFLDLPRLYRRHKLCKGGSFCVFAGKTFVLKDSDIVSNASFAQVDLFFDG